MAGAPAELHVQDTTSEPEGWSWGLGRCAGGARGLFSSFFYRYRLSLLPCSSSCAAFSRRRRVSEHIASELGAGLTHWTVNAALGPRIAPFACQRAGAAPESTHGFTTSDESTTLKLSALPRARPLSYAHSSQNGAGIRFLATTELSTL